MGNAIPETTINHRMSQINSGTKKLIRLILFNKSVNLWAAWQSSQRTKIHVDICMEN